DDPELLGVRRRPRHPRPPMVAAAVDRVLEQRRVGRVPAADDETLRLEPVRRRRDSRYSHSIVAGGFVVTSRTTRFTAGISFTIREAIVSTRSYGRRAQSAVIASSDVTARIAIG